MTISRSNVTGEVVVELYALIQTFKSDMLYTTVHFRSCRTGVTRCYTWRQRVVVSVSKLPALSHTIKRRWQSAERAPIRNSSRPSYKCNERSVCSQASRPCLPSTVRVKHFQSSQIVRTDSVSRFRTLQPLLVHSLGLRPAPAPTLHGPCHWTPANGLRLMSAHFTHAHLASAVAADLSPATDLLASCCKRVGSCSCTGADVALRDLLLHRWAIRHQWYFILFKFWTLAI